VPRTDKEQLRAPGRDFRRPDGVEIVILAVHCGQRSAEKAADVENRPAGPNFTAPLANPADSLAASRDSVPESGSRLPNPVDSLAASRDPDLGSHSWARFSLRGGTSLEIDEFPEVADFESTLDNFEQIEQCARGGFRVTQGSVPRAIGDAEVSTQLIQVVAAEFGDQPARKFSGTQHHPAIGGKSTRLEGAADEPVIEGRIVGDEGRRGRSIEPANKGPQRASLRGGFCDHRVVNARQCDDRARQLPRRPQQSLEAVDDPQLRKPNRPDFENRRAVGIEAGRLEVDDDEIRGRDLSIGHFDFVTRPEVARAQRIGERLRCPIQCDAHDAASEYRIDRSLGREQLLGEFDEIHGFPAFPEPIQ
jgi:hypothetical protein